VEILRTAHLPFLDFKVERTQGLRSIEGQHQPLGPRLAGDPSPPSTGAAEVSPVRHQPAAAGALPIHTPPGQDVETPTHTGGVWP